MALRLDTIDAADAPEETLQALHDLYLEFDEWEIPGNPPKPLGQRIVDWAHLPAFQLVRRWLLWEDDKVVAMSGTEMSLEQNLDNAYAWVYVRREARGRGLGRLVATPMLDLVQEQRRRRLAVAIPETSQFSAIPERAGMKDAYLEQHSRLVVADVDWGLVESWIDKAAERASEYELLFRAGPFPEEDVAPYCKLLEVMNTAPIEDFEREPEVVTSEMWRAWEEQDKKRGYEFLVYIARHKPSGRMVGLTQFIYQHLNPPQGFQSETGVDPEHREKGLGRWLKAAMLQKLRFDYPLVERIDTDNAGSNEPMLNINIALGFRPIQRFHVWQGDVATIRERLRV